MKKFCLIILALAGLLLSCTKDIDTTHESFENSSYNISYINQYLKEVETVSGNSANFDSIPRYQISSDELNGLGSGVYWSDVYSHQKYPSEFLLEISDYPDLTWHISDNYIEDFIWNDNLFHCERGLYFNNGWLVRLFADNMIIIGRASPTGDYIDSEYAYNIYFFLNSENVFMVENDLNLTGRELLITEKDSTVSYIIRNADFLAINDVSRLTVLMNRETEFYQEYGTISGEANPVFITEANQTAEEWYLSEDFLYPEIKAEATDKGYTTLHEFLDYIVNAYFPYKN